jgi:putative nucleotidyltransferase with HDIG domain
MQDALQAAEELPPFPTTALAVMKKIDEPNTPVEHIARLITVDEVLAAKVLRWVNSPLWGMMRRVTSVQEAVVRLGYNTVKSILYSVCVAPLLRRPLGGYHTGRMTLWKHALMTAVLSRKLAERSHLRDVEAVYMAGLSHDVGALVLSFTSKDYVAEMHRLMEEHALSLPLLERQVLGFGHNDVGAAMLENWKIPGAIVDLVRHHHHPAQLGNKEAYVVHAADYLSLEAGCGISFDSSHFELDPQTFELLKLEPADLTAIVNDGRIAMQQALDQTLS